MLREHLGNKNLDIQEDELKGNEINLNLGRNISK